MAELTREAVVAALQHPAGNEAPADARAQPDEREVVDPAAGAEPPLRQACNSVVVVHEDAHSRLLLESLTNGQHLGRREVRRGDEHTVTGDESGHADADRSGRAELARHRGKGVDQIIGVVGRRDPQIAQTRAIRAECDTEALGPADVDADGGGGHASARAFSSRTVFRMRTSARRFTNPGSGTTSSIARS